MHAQSCFSYATHPSTSVMPCWFHLPITVEIKVDICNIYISNGILSVPHVCVCVCVCVCVFVCVCVYGTNEGVLHMDRPGLLCMPTR